MNFTSLTVRAKLGLAFGGLAALVLLISGLSLNALSSANHRFEGYLEGIGARATLATQVRNAVDRRAIAARNLVLVTHPAQLAEEKALVTQAHADVQATLAQLKKLTSGESDASAQA